MVWDIHSYEDISTNHQSVNESAWGEKGGASLHCFPGGKEMCREAWKNEECTYFHFFLLHTSNAEILHL